MGINAYSVYARVIIVCPIIRYSNCSAKNCNEALFHYYLSEFKRVRASIRLPNVKAKSVAVTTFHLHPFDAQAWETIQHNIWQIIFIYLSVIQNNITERPWEFPTMGISDFKIRRLQHNLTRQYNQVHYILYINTS